MQNRTIWRRDDTAIPTQNLICKKTGAPNPHKKKQKSTWIHPEEKALEKHNFPIVWIKKVFGLFFQQVFWKKVVTVTHCTKSHDH